MFEPAVTGLGLPLLVTVKSQDCCTLVTTVVLLFARLGSEVVEVTVDVAVIVDASTVGATLTTTTMSADVPIARLGLVQVTVPVAPTAGAVQFHPAGAITDWNVVLVGVASTKLTVEAAAGPLFVTVCVYVMSFPARTVGGAAAVLKARSA
jgi:hypothetical protein